MLVLAAAIVLAVEATLEANSTSFLAFALAEPALVTQEANSTSFPTFELAEPPLVQQNSSDACGDGNAWSSINQCLAYFGQNSTEKKRCCDEQVSGVAMNLPWWAWLLIAIGIVLLAFCLISCLVRLGCQLIMAIICCPCRCIGRLCSSSK